jgi:hypothetical protein
MFTWIVEFALRLTEEPYFNEVFAGVAYFIFVFFKAFQQRNVMGLHYHWVIPISYAMATTEVFIISLVAYEASKGISWDLLWFALTIGTGGGLGAVVSMWMHHKYISKETDND